MAEAVTAGRFLVLTTDEARDELRERGNDVEAYLDADREGLHVIRAGFIGLGSQGAPMARRIVDAGVPLTVWARRPETLEPFADTAAAVVAARRRSWRRTATWSASAS